MMQINVGALPHAVLGAPAPAPPPPPPPTVWQRANGAASAVAKAPMIAIKGAPGLVAESPHQAQAAASSSLSGGGAQAAASAAAQQVHQQQGMKRKARASHRQLVLKL